MVRTELYVEPCMKFICFNLKKTLQHMQLVLTADFPTDVLN